LFDIRDNKDIKVAYLGGDYTFSHIAACKLFKVNLDDKKNLVECDLLQNVVLAVQQGKAEYGIIPFWNTSRHKIIEAQEAIIKSSDVFIVGNFRMEVNLCLLSPADSIEQVEKILTISHVVKQVSIWKNGSEKLQKLILEHVKSTVDGINAQFVKSKNAVLCSPIAAQRYARKYGLNILAEKIENPGNATSFFVIKKGIDWEKIHSLYHTILAFPLKEGYRTKTKVKLLIIDNTVYCSQRWPIKFLNGEQWHLIEIDGHPEDFEAKGFIEDLSEYLPEARLLGCYTESIQQNEESSPLFDSYEKFVDK